MACSKPDFKNNNNKAADIKGGVGPIRKVPSHGARVDPYKERTCHLCREYVEDHECEDVRVCMRTKCLAKHEGTPYTSCDSARDNLPGLETEEDECPGCRNSLKSRCEACGPQGKKCLKIYPEEGRMCPLCDRKACDMRKCASCSDKGCLSCCTRDHKIADYVKQRLCPKCRHPSEAPCAVEDCENRAGGKSKHYCDAHHGAQCIICEGMNHGTDPRLEQTTPCMCGKSAFVCVLCMELGERRNPSIVSCATDVVVLEIEQHKCKYCNNYVCNANKCMSQNCAINHNKCFKCEDRFDMKGFDNMATLRLETSGGELLMSLCPKCKSDVEYQIENRV